MKEMLNLNTPRIVAGTTHGLMQKALIVNLEVNLPISISGFSKWIHTCLPWPKLQKLLHPLLEKTPDKLDAEWVARWITHLSSALQKYLGEPVGWGTITNLNESKRDPHIAERWLKHLFKKSETQDTGGLKLYELAIPCHRAEFGHTTLKVAKRILQEVILHNLKLDSTRHTSPQSLSKWIEQQLKPLNQNPFSINNLQMMQAAEQLGIPWLYITNNVYQLGYGCHARRASKAQFTDRTSSMGIRICQQKTVTSLLLAKSGLPVPTQGGLAKSPEHCVVLAEQLGYPVVVKPVASSRGRGVTPYLMTQEDVLRAYTLAKTMGQGVLVEKHIEGRDYRLLVVGGHMIAASWRIPAGVWGDGKHTVRELTTQANRDPRRGKSLTHLTIDKEAINVLARSNLMPDSIPETGQFAPLRCRGNIHAGGTAEDMTSRVHPDNRLMAERAARIVGLDIAGIDFMTPDISHSYRQVGGAINEVNAGPAFTNHRIANPDRHYVSEVLEWMFKKSNGRIPIAAITGLTDTTPISHMLQHIFLVQGITAGVSTTTGTWIGEKCIGKHHLNGYEGGRALLMDATVEAAIIELSHQDLIKNGCPFDWCDVVACLDAPDPMMIRIEQDVIKRAQQMIVISTEQPQLQQLLNNSAPNKIIVVNNDHTTSPSVQRHLAAGGIAVLLKQQNNDVGIIIQIANESHWVMSVDEISMSTQSSSTQSGIGDILFTIAIAHAMGHDIDRIHSGITKPPHPWPSI